MTRQQRAVADAMAASEGFRSAQELHASLRAAGNPIGLTTVYRALRALGELGEVDTLRMAGGEVQYRRCSPRHHHHLVCRRCGCTVEVAGRAVERWAERVAAEHGFTDIEHTVEVVGRCPDCVSRDQGGSAPP